MTDNTTAPAPARAWRVVLEKIERDLLDGRLGPGDRLPSERDLVAQLGVGRSSVREALRVLEVMGLIRTGTGSGPSAGAIVISAPVGGMSALLKLQVAAQGFPIGDVVATRLLLEEWAVTELSGREDRDISRARETLGAMGESGLSTEDFLALDAQFHLSLTEATGNLVVSATMTGLRGAIEGYIAEAADRIDDWEAVAVRLRDEHRAILDAVEAGDGDAARSLLHDHITGYYAH